MGFFELFFVRDKLGRETDFLITANKEPWMLVECKSGSKTPSPHLVYFSKKLKTPLSIQLIENKGYDKKRGALRVMDHEKFFSGFV